MPIPTSPGSGEAVVDDLTLGRFGAAGSFRYNAPVTRHAAAVFILVLLVTAFPLLALMPDRVAATRLAGISLWWWYGGAVAPLSAWLVGLMLLREDRPRSRSR